jgi:hypothetical protein
MTQNPLPVRVGDVEAQKRFIAAHEAFLREFPEIDALRLKMFNMARKKYEQEPDEQAVAAESTQEGMQKRLSQVFVFCLLEVVFDDFGELLILAGNGKGFGAQKNLRGMYEHLVTAAFLAQNPAESVNFNDHAPIEKGKIWNRVLAINPSLPDEFTPEEVQGLHDRYREAKEKLKSGLCTRCGQPKTQEAWTREALDLMAAEVDAATGTDFAKLYTSCYLMPTFISHPTAFGLQVRLRSADQIVYLREESEHEATDSVMRGHGLVLRLLTLMNKCFELGLEVELNARWDAFPVIWGHAARLDGTA